jgi:hypothetical protein
MRDLPETIEVVWGWVKSEDNVAEIASRTDAVPSDLVEGTEWQNSPANLKLPESQWPIMEETKELPKEEMRKQYRHQALQQNLTT